MKPIALIITSLMFVLNAFSQNPCNLNFSIGNDSTLLCGQSYTLQANPGLDNYSWSTGATQSSITVSTSGVYSCTGTELGTELVVNGDFSAGSTGFTTGYVPGPGGSYGLLSIAGSYAIATSPSNAHTNFSFCSDHTTTGVGNMMVVNGASTPGISVWCQTINVAPNTNYQFSAWIANALNDPNVAQLQFTINGVSLGNSFSTSTTACVWNQFFEIWNSGANTSIDICITNLNSSGGGNDFVLDDISFRPVCTYTDQVTVTIPPNPVIQVSTNQTICEGENVDITASSVSSNMSYTWTPGGVGATINVSPTTTSSYSVVGEDANGCISNTETVTVNVNPLPVITFQGNDTICEGTAGIITASSSISQSDFIWTNNNIALPTITVAPDTTTVYEVIATSPNGCSDSAEFEMTVIEQLAIEIEGNTVFCEGDQNSLEGVSNLSGTDFLWLPRNETGSVLNTTIADLGWVYLEGTHPICGTEIDSIELVLGQKPTVSLPDSINICLGDEGNVLATSSLPNSGFTWFPGGAIGASQTFSPAESSYFYVQANVEGCLSDLDSIFISVNPVCDVEVPNVFTPNADGINDFFKLISHEGIQSLECVIVNRWGNVINEFEQPDFKWDGKDKNGNSILDGTYFYIINAKTITGEEVKKSGFVQLITK